MSAKQYRFVIASLTRTECKRQRLQHWCCVMPVHVNLMTAKITEAPSSHPVPSYLNFPTVIFLHSAFSAMTRLLLATFVLASTAISRLDGVASA